MACYCDESADAWHTKQRKARKQHECYECDGTIEPGDTYTVASWCWVGEGWSSVKICEYCWHDWEYLLDQGHCVIVGELKESWREHWTPPKKPQLNYLTSVHGAWPREVT